MNNIDADKGEFPCKTISTTQKRIKGCAHPVVVAVSGTADCSVAQTVAIALSVPARIVSTGCMIKGGYR